MVRRRKYEAGNARKILSGRVKAILILAAVVLLLVGGLTARYVWQSWSDYAAVTSKPFYFTVDLLGDSKMESNADGDFSLDNPTKGTWHLYGGGEKKVTFCLQNYYDDLRITKDVIEYGVEVNKGDIDGVTLTDEAGNMISNPMKLGASSGGTSSEDDALDKAEQTFCLTIPGSYKETKTVTVTIQSTKPYKKTIELSFVVYPPGQELTYEVVDSVNSPYAELIIRNGTDKEVQPTINWNTNTLSIDNTNELTFTDNFTSQENMENGNMQISRKLKPGESVSIYFFKSEIGNYAMPATNAEADGNDPANYTITINNPT